MAEEREMTEQEEQALYAEVAGEVFGTEDHDIGFKAIPEPQLPIQQEQKEEVDPWAGVSPAIRSAFDTLNTKLADLNVINERLKQAERRVGGLNNKLAELSAVKPVEKPPTPEQVAQNLESEEKLNEFLKDFPVHAEGIKALVAKGLQGNKGLPVEAVEKIREELQTDFNEKLSLAQKAFELKLLKTRYKNHVEIATSADYQAWLAGQDEEVKAKANGWDALDSIEVLDKYHGDKKAVEALPDITGERNARLESAAVDTRRKSPTRRQKTEAEMTEEELYAHYAKEIWRT